MARHSTMTKVRGRIIYSLYYSTPFCLYALQHFFQFSFSIYFESQFISSPGGGLFRSCTMNFNKIREIFMTRFHDV